MQLVLAILGIIWTVLSSILWIIEIVSLCSAVRYGGVVTGKQLWNIGITGSGIFLFAMALFPYVAPLLKMALIALLNSIGGERFAPIADSAIDTVSNAASKGAGAVVSVGKTIAAEVAERLPPAANNILPAAAGSAATPPAVSFPSKVELVMSQPVQVVMAPPANHPAPPPAPAAPAVTPAPATPPAGAAT